MVTNRKLTEKNKKRNGKERMASYFKYIGKSLMVAITEAQIDSLPHVTKKCSPRYKMSDPRFARVKSDPRFRKPRKHQAKVVVDERFKGVFERGKEKKARSGAYY